MGRRFTHLCILIGLLLCLVAPAAGGEETGPQPGTFTSLEIQPQADSAALGGSAYTPSPLEIVGQIGGLTVKPAVQGNYAYLGQGLRLLVFNVSNPDQILLVGQSDPLPYGLDQSAVFGSYAYVLGGQALTVLSVSNPTHPVVLGSLNLGKELRALAALESKVVLLSEAGVHIISTSNPALPSQVDFIALTGGVELVMAGPYACVTAGAAGLYVVNLSSASAAYEGDWLTGLGTADELAALSNYLYVSDRDTNTLNVVEISSGGQLSQRGSYLLPVSGWEAIIDLAAGSNKVYVAAYAGGLRVIDVSNPILPVEQGRAYTGIFTYEVSASGSYAYAVDLGSGLHVFDASGSTNPLQIDAYAGLGGTLAFDLFGDYAFVYDNMDGLRVVDTSDPADMQLENGLAAVNSYSEGIRIEVAAVMSQTYFVNPGNFYQVDTGDPNNLTTQSAGLGSSGSHGLALSGDYAYVTNYYDSLYVVNTAASPFVGFTFFRPGDLTQIAADQDFAYLVEEERCSGEVCFGTPGVYVLDLRANPGHPTWYGFFLFPRNEAGKVGKCAGIALNGSTLLVLENSTYDNGSYVGGGLHLIDVSNPAAPGLQRFLPLPGKTFTDLTVSHGYAFLLGWRELGIVDVYNPLLPALFRQFSHPGSTGIVVSGDLLYTSDDRTVRGDGLVAARLPYWKSAEITPAGGSLVSTFDHTGYQFPAGVFTETVQVEHTYRLGLPGGWPAGQRGIWHAFAVQAAGPNGAALQPGGTFTLTVEYSPSEEGPVIEDTLKLYYWSGSAWLPEPSSTLDAAANRLTAHPDHLSLWAVFGESRMLYLPLVARAPSH